ncbi:hypothetical protein [Corynebacterium glyciniphilum]|uniref:hypothetical protein n=1 Tax=Corynebacterium glyciniphilum TaxID=1404244 RepID=UPI003FD2D3A2
MKPSVTGIVGLVAFVVISSQAMSIQYGPTGALSGAAIGLVLGAVFAYMVSPQNDWRPRNPLWVIVPLVAGIALVPTVFGVQVPLGIFAFLAAWMASPRMWQRWAWLTLSAFWLVLVAGFFTLALMIAW